MTKTHFCEEWKYQQQCFLFTRTEINCLISEKLFSINENHRIISSWFYWQFYSFLFFLVFLFWCLTTSTCWFQLDRILDGHKTSDRVHISLSRQMFSTKSKSFIWIVSWRMKLQILSVDVTLVFAHAHKRKETVRFALVCVSAKRERTTRPLGVEEGETFDNFLLIFSFLLFFALFFLCRWNSFHCRSISSHSHNFAYSSHRVARESMMFR